ncbi:MAG: hypothetical protein M3R68_09050, partial [Acidobacteriota bacterium]|nr:hypothetical protein [Acidobacteriota bacterium]
MTNGKCVDTQLRVSASPCLRVFSLAFCLLLSAGSAFAQLVPKQGSPLYGGRPENGPVATGLP